MVGMVQTGLDVQTTVTSGIIRGVVSDGSGAVVPGATIVLLARESNQHLTRITNDAFLCPPRSLWVCTRWKHPLLAFGDGGWNQSMSKSGKPQW